MPPRKKMSSIHPPIPIGNCEVVVEARSFSFESNQNTLQISLSKNVKINISLIEDVSRKHVNDNRGSGIEETGDYSCVLINPKDVDDQAKSILQEVLKMYSKELPAMKFAANTGKQSTFLEKCVLNGKYCTLLLKSNSTEGPGEVISAITYQIIPPDTQYAEVPLAAVNSVHQHKGIGRRMYVELKKRLQGVGINSIFCWADKESEGFWLKQGFVSIGEVNPKGRARRLPIKADIRRALCFPGGSTLMVSHLNNQNSADPQEPLKLSLLVKPPKKSKPSASVPVLCKDNAKDHHYSPRAACEMTAKDIHPDNLVEGAIVVNGAKKRVWETSHTSLMSKKVKGSHLMDCELDSVDSASISDGKDDCFFSGSSKVISWCNHSVDITLGDFLNVNHLGKDEENCKADQIISGDHADDQRLSTCGYFKIMLMNIADDAKKSYLAKIIGDLGGTLTSDGSVSTHVVTGKVRRTLNFCTALCSGAWVVSPGWLKESFRNSRFLDETPFILDDADYVLKYRNDLRSAVLRAKTCSGALLKGFDVCLAAHVQPPVSTLSAIVRSAGGKVIRGLGKVNEGSKTVFIACEEDMEDALAAVKKGIWTFSSEWFMNCIMRQELDLEAPQFAESL